MATDVSVERTRSDYYIASWNLVTNEVGDSIELGEFADKTLQVTGTFNAGTLTIEGSMDGTNWVTLTDVDGTNLAVTAATLTVIRENPRYIRPSASNTASLDLNIYIGSAVSV